MYVCICKGITDTHIKALVRDGASDLKSIMKNLGLASQCAKCVKQAKAIIEESSPVNTDALLQPPTTNNVNLNLQMPSTLPLRKSA